MQKPTVTILIRSINRDSLLSQTLASIASQTWPAIKVLVIAAVPDHNPLPTRCGVFELELVPTDTRLHRSEAANRGLALATSDYLMLIDDDDLIFPDHVQKLISNLLPESSKLAAYSDYELINLDGQIISSTLNLIPYSVERLYAGNWMPPFSVLFRRELVSTHGCRFDRSLDLFEDWDFWIQVAQFSDFIYAPGISGQYRIHESSGVHQISPFISNHHLHLYRKWFHAWTDEQFSQIMRDVWDHDGLKNQLLSQSQQIEALLGEQKNLQFQIEASVIDRQNLQFQINHILQSNSWRLTKPLRAIKYYLRHSLQILTNVINHLLQPESPNQKIRKIIRFIKTHGLEKLLKLAAIPPDMNWKFTPDSYADWIKVNEIPVKNYSKLQAEIKDWPIQSTFSVLVPTHNSNMEFLKKAIESVKNQVYPYWELCIADDASESSELKHYLRELTVCDPRIRVSFNSTNGHISATTNTALTMAEGNFIALLDHDDLLHPLALWFVAKTITKHPDVALIFTDEDKLNLAGQRCDPYFKCDFNYELFLAQNMISHLGCYRRDLVNQVGGFRVGLEGSQDYDLALRVLEKINHSQIIHIPRVLYHWRVTPNSTASSIEAKPYALIAARQSIKDHLQRIGSCAQVVDAPDVSIFQRVIFSCPTPEPKVSILIPVNNLSQSLYDCLNSIFKTTDYHNLEVIVVLYGESKNPNLVTPPIDLAKQVKWITTENSSLFLALNHAASVATGSILCFLNPELIVKSPDWIREMVGFASQPRVGVVGARLLSTQNTITRSGIVFHDNKPYDAFMGLQMGEIGYQARAALHQSFSAVPVDCMLISKDIFLANGCFNPLYPNHMGDIDLCLRLNQIEYRTVWTPHVQLIFNGNYQVNKTNPSIAVELQRLQKSWPQFFNYDPAFSPNLTIQNGRIMPNSSSQESLALTDIT